MEISGDYHNCCGMDFISDFNIWGGASLENKNQLKELTKIIQEDVNDWNPLPGTRAALAVLTDDQMKIWAPTFKEQGWRLILRWRNPNSGNVCNLLSNSKKTTVPKPFDW